MLPVVFSMSRGTPSGISFDAQQRSELILTIAQSFAGLAFLINMEFTWWEALAMFVLFVAQFVLPTSAHDIEALIFFAWTVVEMIRFLIKRPARNAFSGFRATWRAHVSG
jgi:cation:H+ antiporter